MDKDIDKGIDKDIDKIRIQENCSNCVSCKSLGAAVLAGFLQPCQ